MDQQMMELLRDRFDSLDSKMEALNDTMANHVEKDEVYWRKIDHAEGQITMIKAVGSTLSLSGIGAWLFSHFGK
jgi:hypothetical protein